MMSRFFENASSTSIQTDHFEQNTFATILILTALVLLGSTSGCASLTGKTKGPLDNIDTSGLKREGYTFGDYGANKPITTEDGRPAIVLEVNNGKRHFEKLPLVPGQSLFIADVIRDAKLNKKIGRLKATVLRPDGKNKPPIRMEVDFDDSGKRVMEGQNYSLRPGDHVVVSHDDRNVLTSMMPSLSFLKR